MKLVECVPNFSEGNNKNVIDSITSFIDNTAGVKLLDVDMGKDTNRTVVTFVGTPDGVVEAAFKAIKRAGELIDMSKHKGEHPRMGACDVCPFIPVNDVTIEECVELAERLGRRVAEELNIPVYLYEHAAKNEYRRNLANIRKGEYEGLKKKLENKEWAPDFGKPIFNERSGATVMGVRDFLIAYNINLATKDRKIAHDIALTIRESGRSKKDKKGNIVKDEKGIAVKQTGLLKECKAIGWYIEDYGIAQISINLTNYKITPPHIAFDMVCREAEKRGVRVTGSELVGLIPLDAIVQAGEYYLKKQGRSIGVPERDILFTAVKSLGLDELYPFDYKKKIIEYAYKGDDGKKLVDMKIRDFSDELSSDSPAPGGGSVAALNGVMFASLISMVCLLTHGKKGYEKSYDAVDMIAARSQKLKQEFLNIIDDDTQAFNKVMDAMKMPKKTDEQIKAKNKALLETTKEATLIPYKTLELIFNNLDILDITVKNGNKNSVSDVGVAALNAVSGAEGAYMNIMINLANIDDDDFKNEIKAKTEEMLETIKKECSKIIKQVYKII